MTRSDAMDSWQFPMGACAAPALLLWFWHLTQAPENTTPTEHCPWHIISAESHMSPMVTLKTRSSSIPKTPSQADVKTWIGYLTRTTEAWWKGDAEPSPMAMRVEEELS